MPSGRLTKFTKTVAGQICDALMTGMSLREVCRADRMPSEATVRQWALEDREGFSAQYTQARQIGYQVLADELLEIADDGSNDWIERQGEDKQEMYVLNGEHVQRSRLRLDTRKWMLSKVLPKIYGEKVAVGGDPENPIVHRIERVIIDPANKDSESL